MILVIPSCLPQGQRDIGFFNNLKADFRSVTYRMTFSTKSTNQNIIIFLNEVQSTIIGHKHWDLLAILDELNPTIFPDRRAWLFGFHPYFSQNNSNFMRRTFKQIGLQGHTQVGFLILSLIPPLVPLVTSEFPGSMETIKLSQLVLFLTYSTHYYEQFLTQFKVG